LVGAVLRQVLEDARSPNTDWRNEARWFLQDERAIGFWCSLAGIDPEAFQAHVQQALGPG
jgi:hypothetical protein